MSFEYISLVVEGHLDETIAKALLNKYSPKTKIRASYNKEGRSQIRKRIASYNMAARIIPFIVLVDLDQDECSPILISKWLPRKHPQLFLRVAVRQVEAWLLADREAIAKFLSVGLNRIPVQPETIERTPELIMGIASKSRKKTIREDIPPLGDTAKRGPDYNGQLSRFVLEQWNPERARKNAPSLDRTIVALQRL